MKTKTNKKHRMYSCVCLSLIYEVSVSCNELETWH